MIPRNKQDEYNTYAQEIATDAWSGQRIYFPEPMFYTDARFESPVCNVLRVSSQIPMDAVSAMASIEFPNSKSNYSDLILTRLIDSIKDDTWKTNNTPFADRFSTWPLNSYEEWLTDEHPHHWATAQTFGDRSFGVTILITVFAPVNRPLEEYKYEYGSSIVMTKLGIGL